MKAIRKTIGRNKSAVKKANKRYKDSVFTKLFSDKNKLLELYSALDGKSYGKDTEIQITTLKDALYMDRINDISFMIDGKVVVLIEHQSTINGNMPLRMLFYISRIYDNLVKEREENLYLRGTIPIPFVEFFVLYNGLEEIPDKQVLKLSDAFIKDGEKKQIMLELEVKVLNINKGRNRKLTAASPTLNEYEIFIDLVRKYEKETASLVKAIETAVDECIKRNVLREFLERHSSEVRNMLNREWNWDKAREVWETEARTEGRTEGRTEVIAELNELVKKGVSFPEAMRKLSVKNKPPVKNKKQPGKRNIKNRTI